MRQPSFRVAIVSDVHYAGAAERLRGDYTLAGMQRPLARALLRAYRRFIWLRDPFAHNHLLDQFLEQTPAPDFVVANGDYSCDSAFVGVSDDAACASAAECLAKLRGKFSPNFQASFGDHELGKMKLGAELGGPRLSSYHRAVRELGLPPFWQVTLGNYVLIGLVSTVVALPVYEPETLPEERAEWRCLREEHLAEVARAFDALRPEQRVLLFCHDPTALPFLLREEAVRRKLPQVEQTIIGHLHTPLLLWKSRLLAGMPRLERLGPTARRLTAALNEARHWKPFNVRLCPSLTGIELLKDGGFYTVELDAAAREPARFELHRVQWKSRNAGISQ